MVEAVGELVAGTQQRTRHDGTRVDHRVVRQPVIGQRQFVESAAAGLAADVPVHGRDAVFLQGQAVVDRLAEGLHAEQVSGVTDAEALSVDRADRDAKLLRIDPLELRNVVGHRAPVIRPHTVVHVGKLAFQAREVRHGEITAQRPGDQPAAGLADGGELLHCQSAAVVAIRVRQFGHHLAHPGIIRADSRGPDPGHQFHQRNPLLGIRFEGLGNGADTAGLLGPAGTSACVTALRLCGPRHCGTLGHDHYLTTPILSVG